MNPLAELAVLLGELCMFMVMRVYEIFCTAFLMAAWLFFPRWPELIQYYTLFDESNRHRSTEGRRYYDMGRNAGRDRVEWYEYSCYTEIFIQTFVVDPLLDNVVWLIALPTWLGFCTPYSFIVIFHYSKGLFHYAINRNDCKGWLYDEALSARLMCWPACIYGLVDLLCMPVVLIASLHPFLGNVRERYYEAYVEHYCTYWNSSTSSSERWNIHGELPGDFPKIWGSAFWIVFRSVIDLLILVPGILCIVMTPSCYVSTFKDIARAWGDYRESQTVIEEAYGVSVRLQVEQPDVHIPDHYISFSDIRASFPARNHRVAAYEATFRSIKLGDTPERNLKRQRNKAMVELKQDFWNFIYSRW